MTLDAPVAHAVDRLVEGGRVASFSAAIDAAAARWVVYEPLRASLDELYQQDSNALARSAARLRGAVDPDG